MKAKCIDYQSEHTMFTLNYINATLNKFKSIMSYGEYRTLCKMRQLLLMLNAIQSLRQKRIEQAKAQAREQQAIRLLQRLRELSLFDEFPVSRKDRKKIAC